MEDRLYKFAQVVDAGSFTKAAAKLHISQPALTTAIKKLERELKAELLVRGSHSFMLTPAGELAYRAARDLRVHADNLRLNLATLADQKVALRLGVIDAIADVLFVHGDYLPKLEQRTHLSLTVDSSRRLAELVEQDELDIAFVAAPASLPGTLTSVPLGQEPLLFVSPPARTAQALQDYQQGTIRHFLAYNHSSQTYQLIARHFSAAGVQLEPRFYSTSPAITLQLLLAGKGVAVLPYLLVHHALHNGQLQAVPINTSPLLARNIQAIYRKGKLLPPETTSLIDQAREGLAGCMHDAVQFTRRAPAQ